MRTLFQRRIQRLAFLVILTGLPPCGQRSFVICSPAGSHWTPPGASWPATIPEPPSRMRNPATEEKLPTFPLGYRIAPDNGLATFRLTGTGIDTILGIYQIKSDGVGDPNQPTGDRRGK